MPKNRANEKPSAPSTAQESRLKVLFVPDWRDGVPYQSLLASALAQQGVDVVFPSGYRRVLPLWRSMSDHPSDLLHIHWPEAYFPQLGDWLDPFRRARFSMDLALATKDRPLVVTAHNLLPHDRANQSFIHHNARALFRRASAVIAHSEAARSEIIESFNIDPDSCHVIPHGDLSVEIGTPLPRDQARGRLDLDAGKLCLMFGAVESYKGIEEVLQYWARARPEAKLVIAGKPISSEYSASLAASFAGDSRVSFHFGRLSNEQLRLWLSAADCVIFNYRKVFTSGAACLARAWGTPLLIPARLRTVDLDEPSPLVLRFDGLTTDFGKRLCDALDVSPDYDSASSWRKKHAWSALAESTAKVYRQAIAAL